MPDGCVLEKVCEVKHKALETRFEEASETVDKRLAEHGKQLDELIRIQAQNSLILEQLTKQQTTSDARLDKLEEQPKQKWNALTQTIMTTIVSGVVSAVVAALMVFIK